MERIKNLKDTPKLSWLAWPLWLVVCFLAAGYVGGGLIIVAARSFGFGELFTSTLGILFFQVLIYVILLGLIFSIPQARAGTTKQLLGIGRPISWGDIGLGVAGYVVYFIILIAAILAITQVVPQFNASQSQDLGFTALFGIERIIGFILFVVIAPLTEELIMRGFLYGRLRKAAMPMWPAAIIVSILFGAAHGQWNVGVDTFILSMAACYLREVTGTIWPGVIIHMLKNMVAYIMLFVVLPLR